VFYVRGADYVLKGLNARYRGFSEAVFSLDEAARESTLSACKKTDADALYWAGAGILGAFSLSPLDTAYIERLPGAVAMLERSVAVDPLFTEGPRGKPLRSSTPPRPSPSAAGKTRPRPPSPRLSRSPGERIPRPIVPTRVASASRPKTARALTNISKKPSRSIPNPIPIIG
jgi:hypothetical protein